MTPPPIETGYREVDLEKEVKTTLHYACTRCGVLVDDRRRHTQWHADQDNKEGTDA